MSAAIEPITLSEEKLSKQENKENLPGSIGLALHNHLLVSSKPSFTIEKPRNAEPVTPEEKKELPLKEEVTSSVATQQCYDNNYRSGDPVHRLVGSTKTTTSLYDRSLGGGGERTILLDKITISDKLRTSLTKKIQQRESEKKSPTLKPSQSSAKSEPYQLSLLDFGAGSGRYINLDMEVITDLREEFAKQGVKINFQLTFLDPSIEAARQVHKRFKAIGFELDGEFQESDEDKAIGKQSFIAGKFKEKDGIKVILVKSFTTDKLKHLGEFIKNSCGQQDLTISMYGSLAHIDPISSLPNYLEMIASFSNKFYGSLPQKGLVLTEIDGATETFRKYGILEEMVFNDGHSERKIPGGYVMYTRQDESGKVMYKNLYYLFEYDELASILSPTFKKEAVAISSQRYSNEKTLVQDRACSLTRDFLNALDCCLSYACVPALSQCFGPKPVLKKFATYFAVHIDFEIDRQLKEKEEQIDSPSEFSLIKAAFKENYPDPHSHLRDSVLEQSSTRISEVGLSRSESPSSLGLRGISLSRSESPSSLGIHGISRSNSKSSPTK